MPLPAAGRLCQQEGRRAHGVRACGLRPPAGGGQGGACHAPATCCAKPNTGMLTLKAHLACLCCMWRQTHRCLSHARSAMLWRRGQLGKGCWSAGSLHTRLSPHRWRGTGCRSCSWRCWQRLRSLPCSSAAQRPRYLFWRLPIRARTTLTPYHVTTGSWQTAAHPSVVEPAPVMLCFAGPDSISGVARRSIHRSHAGLHQPPVLAARAAAQTAARRYACAPARVPGVPSADGSHCCQCAACATSACWAADQYQHRTPELPVLGIAWQTHGAVLQYCGCRTGYASAIECP